MKSLCYFVFKKCFNCRFDDIRHMSKYMLSFVIYGNKEYWKLKGSACVFHISGIIKCNQSSREDNSWKTWLLKFFSAPNIPVSVSNEKETVMQKIKDGLYRVQVKFCEFLEMILYCFTYAFICHFVYFFTWNCFLLINVTQVRHDESFSNAKCADVFLIWMNCVILCIGWFWILLLLVNFYAKK